MAQQNTYELTYIINPVRNDDQTQGIVNRVRNYVNDNGGNVLEVDEWGNQRLAYQIDKKRNGYYVNMYFEGPGSLIQGLERMLRLNDDVLRYLTLKMDAKMLRHYNAQKAATPVEEGDES